MKLSRATGDFTWVLSESFVAGKEYRLKIETEDNNAGWDADDISWDDIVLVFEDDTPAVNHYRIIHPDNALTCELANVKVQACSNSNTADSCELAGVNESIDLSVNNLLAPISVELVGGLGQADLQKLIKGSLKVNFTNKSKTYCNNDVITM